VRVRVRFSKLGKVRWTSHRDVARMWERAFRRLQLPVAYTEGFSPRPKVSFGLALPTGHESEAEYLDVEFAPGADLDVEELPCRLSPALPRGVDATGAAVIEPGTPSLQEAVTISTWRFAAVWPECSPGSPQHPGGQGPALVASLLDAAELVVPRFRKGEEVLEDVRPGILSLRTLGDEEIPAEALSEGPLGSEGAGPSGVAVPGAGAIPGGLWLAADLAAQPRSLRPSDVVRALGPDATERHVRRLHQWISCDGARWEPVAALPDATDAPHALGRAS
jgi:radical SAM-linked protein